MPRTFRITVFFISALLLAAGAVAFLWNRSTFSPAASNSETLKLSSSDAAGAGELAEYYVNSDFGFSFNYPADFRVTELAEEDGLTILVEAPGPGQGFQISIAAFDEPGPLTAERIQRDLPDKIVRDPRETSLGGVPALSFSSREETAGDTYEVWFVHNGSLYQAVTIAEFAEKLSKIIATFRFE